MSSKLDQAIALLETKFPDFIIGRIEETNTVKIVLPDHYDEATELHKVLAALNEAGFTGSCSLEASYRDIEEQTSPLIRQVVQGLNNEVLYDVAAATSDTQRRIKISLTPVDANKNPAQMDQIAAALKTHILAEVEKQFPSRDVDLFFDMSYPFKNYPTFNLSKNT